MALRMFVNVDVPSVEDAARFYVAALGLRIGRRMGDDMITSHAYGRMALFADPFGHGFCLCSR